MEMCNCPIEVLFPLKGEVKFQGVNFFSDKLLELIVIYLSVCGRLIYGLIRWTGNLAKANRFN